MRGSCFWALGFVYSFGGESWICRPGLTSFLERKIVLPNSIALPWPSSSCDNTSCAILKRACERSGSITPYITDTGPSYSPNSVEIQSLDFVLRNSERDLTKASKASNPSLLTTPAWHLHVARPVISNRVHRAFLKVVLGADTSVTIFMWWVYWGAAA